VTYYYSAFTHSTADNHTSGLNAQGTPFNGTPFSTNVASFTATVGDGQVSLSWDSTTAVANGATGVMVRRSTAAYPTSESNGELVYDGAATSTIDRGQLNSSGYKGLTNGTVYYYRAFANDGTDYATGVNALAASASHSSDLIAYYPFSGNVSDGSGQGNHGTLVGSTITTDRNGTAGQAYYFFPGDGNDYIDISSPVDENFTIGFWVQSTQALGAETDWRSTPGLVSAYTGADQNDFGVGIASGQVLFGTGTGGSPEVSILSPSSGYNSGDWYHVTAVRTQATGSLKVYIQGTEVVSGTGSTNTLNAPSTMRFGGFPDDTTFFEGKIDDVRIYDRVLNLTEIQDLYFSGAATREYLISTSDSDSSNHTCLLVNVASGDQNIKCWGNAGSGILGDGGSTGTVSTPVAVDTITTAVQISSGLTHNCAVLSDNTIQCWGEGTNGKLGNGSTSNQTSPVAVSSIIDAAQVAAGGEHSCAVLDNGFSGTVKCWGDASSGQLGNGTSTGNFSTPQLVTGVSTAVQVDTGNDFTCALLADRTIQCWGNGDNGKLGNGATLSQNTPVPVSGITNAVQLSVGYAHACALMDDNTIKCWGDGTNARMGDGFSNVTNSTATTVSGITNAIQVVAGYAHSCALLSDATIKCWGFNDQGQLGDLGTTTQDAPVAVSGITTATSVSVGGSTTCAILSDGTAKCWGEGTLGELGDGIGGSNATPQLVDNTVLENSAKQ
jgi:alpha-tubulin suppressor-like RCC1 family protein